MPKFTNIQQMIIPCFRRKLQAQTSFLGVGVDDVLVIGMTKMKFRLLSRLQTWEKRITFLGWKSYQLKVLWF